jgi:ABC-2 type transport system ATP-binding protein
MRLPRPAAPRPGPAPPSQPKPPDGRGGERPRIQLAPPEPPALHAHGVAKRWGRRGPLLLDGIDLTLEGATACRLTGRNGTGKTTLVRIAAGLIAPDAGGVRIRGLAATGARREYQRRVGFLSAGGGLYARLSVRRHLDMWSRLCLMAPDERGPAITRALARFRLEELEQSRADRLSMGQRQRVRIAMALLHDPDVVLLDEPRNSLDDEGVEALERALRTVLGRGGAVLWASPTAADAPFAFDQAYVLDGGVLHEAG